MLKQGLSRKAGWLALVPALASLALLAGCSSLTAPAPSAQEGELANTLTVSGVGQASGPPELATVELGVVTSGPEVGPAVAQSNQTAETVMDALAQAGVAEDDIQTTGFNVWSEEHYPPGLSFEEGGAPPGEPAVIYRVENSVRATVRDVEVTGDVIQVALDAGANQVRGVSFSIEDTTALEEEAQTQAIENARARAADLAEKMGVTLGDPMVISEGPRTGGFPAVEAAYGLGGGGGPPISAGQMTVSVQVNVTFGVDQ